MTRYQIVSADAHILEPTDIWDTWFPEKYADKAPKLVKDVDGGDAWLFAGAPDPDPIGLVSTPGMAWDKFRWTGVTYEEARAGCYNGAERLKDMDIDGVDAEVLFPPQRTIGHFLGDEDDDFVLAGVEALQQLPVRGVLRARPHAPHRHGADPVARHRRRRRLAPQSQGARLQGCRDLELAVGRRERLRRRRPVLGGGVRRGHARLHPHQHHLTPHPPEAAQGGGRGGRQGGRRALRRQGGQGQRQGGGRPGRRVRHRAQHHRPADLHRCVRALPRSSTSR